MILPLLRCRLRYWVRECNTHLTECQCTFVMRVWSQNFLFLARIPLGLPWLTLQLKSKAEQSNESYVNMKSCSCINCSFWVHGANPKKKVRLENVHSWVCVCVPADLVVVQRLVPNTAGCVDPNRGTIILSRCYLWVHLLIASYFVSRIGTSFFWLFNHCHCYSSKVSSYSTQNRRQCRNLN